MMHREVSIESNHHNVQCSVPGCPDLLVISTFNILLCVKLSPVSPV